MEKPSQKPHYPFFSSGPCAKPPGWSFDKLKGAELSRSHRSKPAVAKLQEVIDKSRSVLQIPDDYLIGIVPASDTGALERQCQKQEQYQSNNHLVFVTHF